MASRSASSGGCSLQCGSHWYNVITNLLQVTSQGLIYLFSRMYLLWKTCCYPAARTHLPSKTNKGLSCPVAKAHLLYNGQPVFHLRCCLESPAIEGQPGTKLLCSKIHLLRKTNQGLCCPVCKAHLLQNTNHGFSSTPTAWNPALAAANTMRPSPEPVVKIIHADNNHNMQFQHPKIYEEIYFELPSCSDNKAPEIHSGFANRGTLVASIRL